MTINEFKNTIENVLQNYVWEKLNEDTEINIINDISEIIEENKNLCPTDFQIEFDNSDLGILKIKITISDIIIECEVK